MAPTTLLASTSLKKRTLIIIIVAASAGAVIIISIIAVILCRRRRRRRRRLPFMNRGISPIDDEEIESWKFAKAEVAAVDKETPPPMSSAGTVVNTDDYDYAEGSYSKASEPSFPLAPIQPQPAFLLPRTMRKNTSTSSLAATLPSIPQEPGTPPASKPQQQQMRIKKPPSVIVYTNTQPTTSPKTAMPVVASSSYTAEPSPRSKKSIDMGTSSPIHARAPNARPGLTDETVQGDVAYLPSPKRPSSRLSRSGHGHSFSNASSTHRHHRTGSSFSFSGGGSSWRDQWLGGSSADHGHHTSNSNSSSQVLFGRRSESSEQRPWTQGNGSTATFGGLMGGSPLSPGLSHSRSLGNVKAAGSVARIKVRHSRIYSDVSVSPGFAMEDELALGGLSPRPSGKRTPIQDIGRAIG